MAAPGTRSRLFSIGRGNAPVEHVLADLDPAQRAAVTAEAPVLAILAGAGSGKTRVLTRRITRRIADGSVDARHVLALTFTRKAAGELRDRLAAMAGHRPHGDGAPAVHTLHAFGGALLQRWWLDRGERPWNVTRDRRTLLDEACAEAGSAGLTASGLGVEIEWAKARSLDPDSYVGSPTRSVDTRAVAAAWRAYEEDKARRRVLDVDDLIALPSRLLADHPGFAAARGAWHRHVFVDEAQDLNPAQLRLIELVAGDAPDLCVVGDPDQAIYGWNGADPALLTDLAASLPPEAVHRLVTNHRSTVPIAAAASSVLGVVPGPVATAGDHSRFPTPSVAGYADEGEEAGAIAHLLQEARWRGSRSWSSMAVLVRTGVQLDVVATALAVRDIPHRLPGTLLDRPEVVAALRALRAIDDGRGATLRQLIGDLPDVCERVLAAAAAPDPGGASAVDIALLVDPEPVVDDGAATLRRAHLDALGELVAELAQAVPGAGLDAFRSWSRGVLGARGGEAGFDVRGVTLTTLHRAKGLEWPVVVVAGCEDGLVPHRRSSSPAAHAEERRLLYVGATRATEELHFTWAQRRTTPWGDRSNRRSPFLADLERSVALPVDDDDEARHARMAGLRAARAALLGP